MTVFHTPNALFSRPELNVATRVIQDGLSGPRRPVNSRFENCLINQGAINNCNANGNDVVE